MMNNRTSKAFIFIILCSIVAGCTPQITQEQLQEQLAQASSTPAPSSQSEAEQTVRNYYKDKLKDPDSALYNFQKLKNGVWFDDRYRYGAMYGWFICGEINAKNSFGGYV